MESRRKPQGHLFRKYLALFVILISGALLTSGLLESYFCLSGTQDGPGPPATGHSARRRHQDRAVYHRDPARD